MGLFSSSNSYLGVDIGSDSIKIVELEREGKNIKLLSYGFSENVDANKSSWENSSSTIARVISKICEESQVKSISAISALPTFSVFSSVLNLSNVTKKDIPSAVHWEAKKVIPLPLDEMILDWKKVESEGGDKGDVKVLLTGAPRTLVERYIRIFKKSKLSLLSLETETFSLIRSLIGHDKSTIMILEIGASTTDVTIVDNGIPMLNRSIDIGGHTITKAISEQLNIDYNSAEQFKYDMGVSSIDSKAPKEGVSKIISDSVSPIVNEIKYAINLFQNNNNKRTEKIILSGGSAFLPGLTDYFSKVLDIKVIIGNPWSRISYPTDLEPLLNEIGPRMSVAIGLALRETE